MIANFMMNKNPLDLVGYEINSYLNSGKYISSATRKMLEDKLRRNPENRSQKNDIIQPFKQCLKKEYFPELVKDDNQKIEKGDIGRSSEARNGGNVINYGNIIENNDTIIPSCLIVDNQLTISFKHILQMYDYYAIYRIRLQYLILNRKIHILDSINYLNVTKGQRFKQIFEYHKWMKEEDKIKQCLYTYMILSQIIHYFKELKLLLVYCHTYLQDHKSLKSTEIDKIIIKTKRECCGIKFIPKMINGNLSEYLSEYLSMIMLYIKFIINTVNNIYNLDKDSIDAIISETSEKCNDIQSIISKIITINDPDLDCNYVVSIEESADNPIIPQGLATFIYLPCNEEINLSTKNKFICDNKLQVITESELREMFSKSKVGNCYNIIKIYLADKYKFININYVLHNVKIPSKTTRIKITNTDKTISILDTMLTNESTNNNISEIYCTHDISDFWINSSTLHQQYRLPIVEYKNMDRELQKKYKHTDTMKNIFHIDFLFNKLLKQDEKRHYIKPEMLKSFQKLAKCTSKLTLV